MQYRSRADSLRMDRRRFAAIVNPIAGRRDATRSVNEIRRLIEEAGGHLDVHQTRGAGHAIELARQLGEQVDALLIVGGDGTVAEVMQGLGPGAAPFVILPTGTENLLARELEMDGAAGRMAETLLRGTESAFDLGMVNGRRLATMGGVGFDAECVHLLSVARRGHISYWSYVGPIGRTFLLHRFPHLRIEVDGEEVFSGQGFVIFGNIGRYAIGLRILEQAQYDDGLLDVAVFPCSSRWQLALHAWSVAGRQHVGRGGVVYRQGRRMRIDGEGCVPVQVDGEAAGFLPIEIEVLAKAVCFLRWRGEPLASDQEKGVSRGSG